MTIFKEAVEAEWNAFAPDCEPAGLMWTGFKAGYDAAAIPFLALRPAPSQSDEEAADAVLFGKERGIHTNDKERDLYAISVASLARAFAAIRAEERERIEAAVRSAPCLDEDGKVIATSVVIDAIRARKPPAPTCAENAQVAALSASPAPNPAEAMRAKCAGCEGSGKAFNAIDCEWDKCLYCGGTGVPRAALKGNGERL